MTTALLLAAGLGDVLPAVFVVIAIISGIMNYVKEKKATQEAQQRRGKPKANRSESLQNEIDSFLREVKDGTPVETLEPQGEARPRPMRQPQSNRPAGDRQQQAGRQQQSGQARQQRQQQQRRRPPQDQPQGQRPPRRRQRDQEQEPRQSERDPQEVPVAARHLASSELSGVRSRHVQSDVSQRHIDSDVSHSHLPTGKLTGTPVALATRQASPLAVILAQTGGVRNAIILNEILSPPVSLRSRK